MSSKVGATIKNKDYSLLNHRYRYQKTLLQAKAEGIGSCMNRAVR